MIHEFNTQGEAERSEIYTSGKFFLFYKNMPFGKYCLDTIDLGHCVQGQKLIKTGKLLKR
jgi:hypothetical protein